MKIFGTAEKKGGEVVEVKGKRRLWPVIGMALGIGLIGCSVMAYGQAQQPPATKDPAAQVAELTSKLDGMSASINTFWTLVTGMLVFFMNLGFACVEAGMCRVKNAVNILSKNFIVFAVSSVAFWVLGWGLMFGDDGNGAKGGGFMGVTGLWFSAGADNSPATGDAYKGVY